jgi:hypothetical protein
MAALGRSVAPWIAKGDRLLAASIGPSGGSLSLGTTDPSGRKDDGNPEIADLFFRFGRCDLA